jgi:hypothetical protein
MNYKEALKMQKETLVNLRSRNYLIKDYAIGTEMRTFYDVTVKLNEAWGLYDQLCDSLSDERGEMQLGFVEEWLL